MTALKSSPILDSIVSVSADLMGPTRDHESVHPEYARGMAELAVNLIGYDAAADSEVARDEFMERVRTQADRLL